MFTIADFWKIFTAVSGGTTDLTDVTKALAQSSQATANKYFTNVIDQIPFNTNDYIRLRSFLRDLYATHKTMTTLGTKITDPHSLSNEHLDELFRSFGYNYSPQLKGIDNNPLDSKIRFFLDLVNLYKIKGTPQSVLEVLQYYGVTELDIFEFWLQVDEGGSLVFRGDPVIGTTVNASQINFPYEFLTDNDPHWFQTQSQILQLNQINKINLPSKSPYIGIQPITQPGAESAILCRTIIDQYESWLSSGILPSQDAEISLLGVNVSLLELYLGIVYTYNKEYVSGIDTTGNIICYDGTNTDPTDILTEYNSLINSIPTSRENQRESLAEYYDLFTIAQSSYFLQTRNDAGTILNTVNPSLKTSIDGLSDSNVVVLNSLLKDLANWVRANIGFGFINLGFILSGMQALFDELKPVIDFFKPYRARLVVLEAIQFKHRLFSSIIIEDRLEPLSTTDEFYDYITGNSIPCALDSTTPLYYSRESYDCGSYFDIGAATDIRKVFDLHYREEIHDHLPCPSSDTTGFVVSETLIDTTAEFQFYQTGGFRNFDEIGSFDCTYGFDAVFIDLLSAGNFLLQENGALLLQENGARIILEPNV
jgi:hypothetical protein